MARKYDWPKLLLCMSYTIAGQTKTIWVKLDEMDFIDSVALPTKQPESGMQCTTLGWGLTSTVSGKWVESTFFAETDFRLDENVY